MEILVFLIPAAWILGGLGLCGFLWALKHGQYDDIDGAELRILSDDDQMTARSSPLLSAAPPDSAVRQV